MADPDREISVMGILNLTDDSFYAGSRCLGADGGIDLEQVIGKIRQMFADGAGIVDIGACSSRPGAVLPDSAEEWRRLRPLIAVLRDEFPDGLFSIDTFRADIVSKCHDALGHFIVNDISAGAVQLPGCRRRSSGIFRGFRCQGWKSRHTGVDTGSGIRFREDP